ncbi:MAG TPA: DUF6290 family protein [Solirubrobacteraceae bacterium]|nr:DUF6290 family protein [Solirubrobacteraceae bacterium]
MLRYEDTSALVPQVSPHVRTAIERAHKDLLPMKTMSLRIDDEQARALNAVAAADGTTVSDVIRDAIADRIEKRRNDDAFQARLRKVMEESREALELLAK